MVLKHGRLSDAEFAANGKDKFAGKIWFPVEIEFYRDGEGKIKGFRVSNFGAKNVKFEKIPDK